MGKKKKKHKHSTPESAPAAATSAPAAPAPSAPASLDAAKSPDSGPPAPVAPVAAPPAGPASSSGETPAAAAAAPSGGTAATAAPATPVAAAGAAATEAVAAGAPAATAAPATGEPGAAHPSVVAQGPETLGGCLLRMGWLVIGPALLFVCAAVIMVNQSGIGSFPDLCYVAVALGVLWLRRVEASKNVADARHIPGGDPAAFTRTFTPVAAGGLVAAHLLKFLFAA